MTDQNSTTTTAAAPAKPQGPVHAHLLEVLHRLDQVKSFAVAGLKKLGLFVEEEAPVVASVAGAVASAIPGVGPAAAAVAKVAGEAVAVAERASELLKAQPPKPRR